MAQMSTLQLYNERPFSRSACASWYERLGSQMISGAMNS